MKKLRVLSFRQVLAEPIEITDSYDRPQTLDARYIVRERDGDLLFLVARSNEEIVRRKIFRLAESRGQLAAIETVPIRLVSPAEVGGVRHRRDGVDFISVAIDSTAEDFDDKSRAYSTTCPFCGHEASYTGTVFQATAQEDGFFDPNVIIGTCPHFHDVDTFDADIVEYVGTLEELGRVDFGSDQPIEGGAIL